MPFQPTCHILLLADCLPRDIVQQGVDIASRCPCRRDFASLMLRPNDKSHLPTQFNETVQRDLFVLWNECFSRLIDECVRCGAGGHIANKTRPVSLQSIFRLWIQMWGLPTNILSDQEGGLVSASADTVSDRFRINRKLVGKDGTTANGLVERHIQLVKLSMLKL